MNDRQCPILGKEKAAPGRAAKSEDSVVRQTRQRHRSRSAERAQIAVNRERMGRKARRSDARTRGAGFGRRPLLVAAA
jgi:hypothetical protein